MKCPCPILTASLVVLMLTGCASLPAGRGTPEVQGLLAARGVAVPETAAADIEALVTQQLAVPLDLPQAVRIALLNNPAVRVEYARLGLAAADVYDAGRLSNPQFSTAVMTPDAPAAVNQVTFGLVQRFSDLLLFPARQRMAQGEFERAQAEAAQAILNLSADTQAAWFRLLGAEALANRRAEQARAASVAAALSQRLFDAGNVSARELAEAQASASSEQIAAEAVISEQAEARAGFLALLGLDATSTRVALAGDFEAPPALAFDPLALQVDALATRLDLAARRRAVSQLEGALTDAHRFRYLGEVSVGVETERETDRSRITGPSLAIELPLFNHGDGKLARASAQLDLARSEQQALEVSIRREVQASASRVNALAARDVQLNTTLIPARTAALARTQEEVNYMLESPFGLLRAKQLLLEAQLQAVETRRDYWLARTELARALGALRVPPVASVTPVAADSAAAHGGHP